MCKEKLTVVELIKRYSMTVPDKPAIAVDGITVTYGELYAKISAVAEFFEKQGIRNGSHVISVATPNLSYVVCMYAALGLGAVHIPAEKGVPAVRLCEIADAVDADFIIAPENPNCEATWINPSEVCTTSENNTSWDPVALSDECSEIIFTTGTTGKSKGVMLSSNCFNVYMPAMQTAFNLSKESVLLVTTPLNHVGGLHRIHQCMSAGCMVVLLDGVRDLKKFFAYIYQYGVTHTYLPPASVKLIITLAKKELAKLDGKLQFIYTASAPFPTADMETFMSLLPNTHLYQGYGSSETGSICNCCYNAPGEDIGCLGKPYPCVEVKLLDEAGNEIHEANKAGRICSKSGMNMLGYYKEPELTAAVLKDGYIYSSDLLYFDENGKLHFAGRSDDVINVKGFKIAPTEVENAAMKYPTVDECVCIPYDDRIQGRVVKIVVKPKAGYELDKKEITEFLSTTLEQYKVPKIIEQIDEIIRTVNGKIDRKKMIEKYSNINME